MARRKIREFDSKRLFSRFLGKENRSVQVTIGTEMEKLAAGNPWLREMRLVVKPDMLFGKRGKNNLVLLDAGFDQAKKFIEERLGKEVEVNGVKGPMTHFIIEPFIPHDSEYYLSIISTRDGSRVNFSDTGGVDIEDAWDGMRTLDIGIDDGCDMDLESLLSGLPDEKKGKIKEYLEKCHDFFIDYDLSFLEMNPLTFDINGRPLPLDMRGELDDTASFKNMKKWGNVIFPQPFGRKLYPEERLVKEMDEKTGASLKLTILNPKGRIWTMVAGGGASVIYTDTVVDMGFGEELGNYGEYSGNPNEEETYQYAKTVIDLATREPDGRPRALLIGGGIANFTDVAKTFKGIIKALKDYKEELIQARMRIYVRRGGPNYRKGLGLMRDLGNELGVPVEVFGPESTMTTIVPMAIDYIRGE